ncbi:poly(3-hydroxyalkanoate) synthetase [Actinomycetospora succinea]|uniref:Poly(3-hydroxyalkanoate) synthetase n=1 Tax=Actinomycetospora succinea TaxID=663603 RepID=A0A4V3DAM3_9PSEU|nr:alpha/beta fold hydrolase [Actinomycetospora succinea]TDQ62623.1 poly(3-hydroxyalkanoate) synthetase [Actinomycetospora succinea]
MTAPADEHVETDQPLDRDPTAVQTEAPSPDPAAYLRGYHATAAVRGAAELTKGAGYVLRRAFEQSTTPGRNTRDAQRWWRHVMTRRRPQWHNDQEIVFETPIARLRDFSQGSTDDVVPTLVLPPQAGHDSCIVDFQPRQSQMMVLRECGLTRAFTLDWVGATRATSGTTISDYIAVVDRAVEHCGGRVNLVGDCQGGWLATIYAAIHPDKVNTLTLAGAPIDFHAGETPIGASSRVMTQRFGQLPYRAMVAAGGGNMPGAFVLGGFIAIRPEAEIAKHVDLLRNLDDPGAIARYEAFEDWFKHTQDVPGTFYLWLVEHLFAGNELINGELEVDGERVDMRNIACPLFLLGGATDHITPPVQVFAAAEHVSTPADQVTKRTAPGGHLGLFMGNQALRHEWPPLMTAVAEHSRPHGGRRSA